MTSQPIFHINIIDHLHVINTPVFAPAPQSYIIKVVSCIGAHIVRDTWINVNAFIHYQLILGHTIVIWWHILIFMFHTPNKRLLQVEQG